MEDVGDRPKADWLQLSSFDAQSFFQAQEEQQEQQQHLQAAHLRAAADYLLPTSSDDESDLGEAGGAEEAQGGEQAGGRGRGRAKKPGKRTRSQDSRSSSSTSAGGSRDRGGSRGRKKRHKKDRGKKEKKKARHTRESRSELEKVVRAERLGGEAQRAQQVKGWASSDQAAKDPFYFDARGDPGNVAFGGLYRADIAAYRRHDPAGFAVSMGARRPGYVPGRSALPSEADGHGLQRGRDLRYYSASVVRQESSTRLRRWHRWLHGARQGAPFREHEQAGRSAQQQGLPGGGLGGRLNLPGTNFIPLVAAEEAGGEGRATARMGGAQLGPSGAGRSGTGWEGSLEGAERQQEQQQQQGETREEYVLRRTREFNAATRERAFELQLWLDFAQFQDEAVRLLGPGQRRAAGERAAAEKKVAILERALTHHPGSDQLLLALLEAAKPLCSEGEMEERWRRVLARHGGSPQLWRRYLQYRRSQFTGFSAARVAGVYLEALQAMHRERQRRDKQGAPADEVEGVEVEMASLAVEWCGLQLQAGHTERGVAGVQALLEWHLFAPWGWGEAAKREMFRDYWASGDPVLGEPRGGRGWVGWLAGASTADVGAAGGALRRGEAEQQQEEEDQEAEAGPSPQDDKGEESWSGWVELAPAIEAQRAERGEEGGEGTAAGSEGAEDDEEGEQVLEEEAAETEEELLERLGMNLEAALEEAANLTPPVLSAWLDLEVQRDASQWQPQRGDPGAQASGGAGEAEAEGARVEFRDVSPLLLTLGSEAAVRQVVMGCLLLLGAPLLELLGSREPAVAGASATSDEVWQASSWLADAAAAAPPMEPGSPAAGQQLEWLAEGAVAASRGTPWYLADPARHQFLLRLLAALVQGPCKGWPPLVHALLTVASQSLGPGAAGPQPAQPPAPGWDWAAGRALGKQLLSEQRGSLVLWGSYAWLEGRAGNRKAARKVYQTCLALVAASLSWPQAKPAATLVLAAAELELSASLAAASSASPLPSAAATAGQAAFAAKAALSASRDAAGAALRLLAWLGSAGACAAQVARGAGSGGTLTAAEVVAARKGYQGLLFSVLEQGKAAFDLGSCDLVACASLFELLEPVAGSRGGDARGAGTRAALAICEQVLAALQAGSPRVAQQAAEGASADAIERLCVWQGALVVEVSARGIPSAPPKAVRATLLKSLGWFPASAGLFKLLLEHGMAGHTIAQLRRDCRDLCAKYPTLQAWLAVVAVEVGSRSPPSALAGVLERAVGCEATRHCPLLWRCYLRLEASRQRPEAVRRVFLRGVGACPWDKALWLDGVALLNGHAPAKELAEYLEIIKDKELQLRTDVYEVLLAQLEEKLVP